MFSSVITKDLNWEILTKSSVTFRGVHEKPIYRWELPKKESLDCLQIYRRVWRKRWGVEGGLIPQCTL